MRQAAIVDDHASRTDYVVSAPVPALHDFQDDVIGLRGIILRLHGLVPVRVERFAQALVRLDAVTGQEVNQLMVGQFDPAPELDG